MSHETTDAAGPRILAFYAALIASVAVVFAVTAVVIHLWAAHSSAIVPPRPPEPALQVDAAADLAAHRAGEAAQSTRYGWIDREHDVVRIPITRAVERMLERGLADTNAEVAR